MVDDILAFSKMFAAMIDNNIEKTVNDDPTLNFSTPLENAKSFKRIKHDEITPEQIDKFISLFDENTTSSDLWDMSGKNAKEVERAHHAGEIKEYWKSDEIEGRGR